MITIPTTIYSAGVGLVGPRRWCQPSGLGLSDCDARGRDSPVHAAQFQQVSCQYAHTTTRQERRGRHTHKALAPKEGKLKEGKTRRTIFQHHSAAIDKQHPRSADEQHSTAQAIFGELAERVTIGKPTHACARHNNPLGTWLNVRLRCDRHAEAHQLHCTDAQGSLTWSSVSRRSSWRSTRGTPVYVVFSNVHSRRSTAIRLPRRPQAGR